MPKGGFLLCSKGKTYRNGTYSYDESTGMLSFEDVLDVHPEFRLITVTEYSLTGTFRDETNIQNS